MGVEAPKLNNSHPRRELIKIEKKIYRQNQQTINDSTDVTDKNFKKYHSHYKRSVKTYQRDSKIEDVLNDMAKTRVTIFGDYHTLDQSQRSFVRFLRSYLRHKDDQFVVALETVQAQHQNYLDQFLSDKIDGQEFIKRIGFKDHWFFDLWDNYAVIFDFLKYHKISVYGIETASHQKKSLLERDKFMAERISDLAKKHPTKKILVLVGDLHLAPKHLPLEIQKQAKKDNLKLPITTLYQNSSEIYWHLSDKDLVDHTLIVKLGDKTYCRMHTPPIIVQQSYINWLYHEEGGFDWIDAKGSFLHIVERLTQVLGLKLPDDYEHVEVYTCGDLSFMKFLSRKKVFTKKELKFIHRQIENSESYYLPVPRIAYIANVSIHHAAEEASHYLKFLLSGLEFPRSHKDAFYANVLHEAVGFFGSKLINNKRKCAHYQSFIAQKEFLETTDQVLKQHVEYETCVLFLKHADLIKKGDLLHTNKISNLSRELFLSLTHALGYDLGDLLYYGFMERTISKEVIQDLYTNPFSDEGEPGEVYLRLIKDLKKVKRPQRL